MSKSNDKQHRIKGTIPSSNTKLPNPLNSYNSPLGSLNNKNNNNNCSYGSLCFLIMYIHKSSTPFQNHFTERIL